METRQAQLTNRSLALSKTLSLLAVMFPVLAVVGWIFNIPLLRQVHPALPVMHPNTALGLLLLAAGILFSLYGLMSDIGESATAPLAIGVFILLAIALLIALGFEFVNGFHDTANAVATVIYTHSLPAQAAVIWSGCWNLFGVITSTGAVAFGIISLLPVELILQVGSNAGFAMIFALLIAAIIWNLGT